MSVVDQGFGGISLTETSVDAYIHNPSGGKEGPERWEKMFSLKN